MKGNESLQKIDMQALTKITVYAEKVTTRTGTAEIIT